MPRIDSRERPSSTTGALAKEPGAAPSSCEHGDSPLRGVVVSPTPKARLALFDPEVGTHLITSVTQVPFNHLYQEDRSDGAGDRQPKEAGTQPESKVAATTGTGNAHRSPGEGAST